MIGGSTTVVRPAVDRALATLSQVWPRNVFVSAIYQQALASYPDDCVQSAAEEWAASQKWPPKPVELADEARRFWRMRYRETGVIAEEAPRCPQLLARQQALREQVERLDKRARWLMEVMKKPCSPREALQQVEAMAGTAWTLATTDDERQALRDGHIGPAQYVEAVRIYRETSRAQSEHRRSNRTEAGGAPHAGETD